MTEPEGARASPLVEMRGITRRFPGVLALDRVELDLCAGEVHVIAGENGAGKSTLLKILAGALAPDDGEIRLDGEPARFASPRDARARGIAIVYQEGSLAPHLTVADNVFLGRELGLFPSRARTRAQTRALLAQVGCSVDPDVTVGELGVASRQLVEIARALGAGGRVLVLDEPTASLSEREVPALFDAIRRLRESGTGIFYVSHRLEELARIGDRVTVLRGGHRVWSAPIAEAPVELIVRHMAGERQTDATTPGVRRASAASEAPAARDASARVVLEVRGLRAGPVRDVDLVVRAGELVGVAGLVGSGRTALLRALFGALPREAGEIRLDGRARALASVHEAVEAGIALVPEDRATEALVPDLGVGPNITLASLSRFRTGTGLGLDLARERRRAGELAASVAIAHRSLDQPILELSGGNQQKAIVARWLCREARLLLCDEPTRGVDVVARGEIFALLRRFAADGGAVVVVSSALPELRALCRRVVVMHRGRLVADVDPAVTDDERLVHLMSLGGDA